MTRLPKSIFAAPLLASLMLAGPAMGDSILVQGMAAQSVTVTGFANGRLQYQTTGGTGDREYERIAQLIVDGEPALNTAEADRAAGKRDGGIEDYVKALRTSARPWVKVYAARRVFDSPDTRFEPKLAAYLALLTVAPDDAADRRPALPDNGSRLIDVAAAAVESTLQTPQLPDKSKIALLSFLADIQRRRGDNNAVVAVVERLAKVSPAAANDPVVQSQLAGMKVTQARLAMDKKDFATATRLIDQARPALVDPQQQADALFVLASVKLATANRSDTAALQDAALMFMRVVAHANPLPGRPNVLASLRATAGILERTGNPADAGKVYRQIVKEFADDPAAVAEAKADAERVTAIKP